MKFKTFDSDKNSKIIFQVIEINKDLTAFKAVNNFILNGESKQIISEGVISHDDIVNAQLTHTMPIPNSSYIKKDNRFLEMVRLYGHPLSVDSDSEFNGVKPEAEFFDLISKNKIYFDDFLNSENIPEIIFIDNYNHEIFNVSENKICNSARFTDTLMLDEIAYSNYNDIINKMVDEKTILIQDGEPIFTRIPERNLNNVNGRLNLTDEDFDTVINAINLKGNYICNYTFAKKLQELNILKIEKHLKTEKQQKIELDQHLSYC